MENGHVPSGKVPFQLSACFIYTLLHHKHLIAEDKLQRLCACVHVYQQLLVSLTIKPYRLCFTKGTVKERLFCSADRIGDTETCNLEPYFLSETHKER